MKTTYLPLVAFAVMAIAASCAEPVGVSNAPAQKGGRASTVGGGSSTASSSGGTTATSTGEGGTTATAKGGTTATTALTNGGATTTTTATGSGGTTTTTTTTTTPSSCETTSGELPVANTPKPNDIGATTSIVPAAALTIPISEVVVKFCFSLLTTSAVTVAPTAMKIYSGGITVPADPYYINISTAKVTVETTTDGPTCLVVDVATLGGTAQLTGKSEIKLDWILDSTALGGAMVDPTKPAQVLAIRAGAVAGCGDVAM